MNRNLLLLIAIVLVLSTVTPLKAQFEFGVEDFSGTTLDTDTWEAHRPETISQNDELVFNNPTLRITEYVTRNIGIAVGQGVRAHVTLDDFSTSAGSVLGLAALGLTDNSTGSTDWWIDDNSSATVRLDVSTNSGSQLTATTNRSGRIFHNFGNSILGQTYLLELERLNSSDVRYAAYELDGSLISETTRSLSLPDSAFILLGSNGSARFDNVVISAVPEPASTTILAVLAISCVARRRRICV